MNKQNSGHVSSPMELEDIEEVIERAIEKIGGEGENDLCKYIPSDSGGYMHHFTLRKMKLKDPSHLKNLIDEHIIQSQTPKALPPKQRAPRGSRKRKDHFVFTNDQLKDLLLWAKNSGNETILSALSPKKNLFEIKRALIQSIKNNQIQQELWQAYVDAIMIESEISKKPIESSFSQ